ncbi:MAG: hypothetical protein HC837_03430 [Chloroflexaceae bacterium]|nr:hypothetical protein [Chloroflexaceae bacterium]
MTHRPGGELSSRPLHLIWICDCSGSMSLAGKMDALNQAIREALPHMQAVAAQNPNAQLLMRVLTFAHGAVWHVPQAIEIERFIWRDLVAEPLQPASVHADVMFLVDTSGSMVHEIETIKQGCVDFAQHVISTGAHVRLGLIGFDIGGHQGAADPAYQVHSLSNYTIGVWHLADPQDFQRNIAVLTPGLFGGSGSYLANADTVDIFPYVGRTFEGPLTQRIVDTVRTLVGQPRQERHLLVISDELGDTSGLDAIVTQLRRDRVTAHVVGVPGANSAHELLARRTGGTFWDITQARDPQTFRQLFDTIALSLAREVARTLTSGAVSAGSDMGQALQMLAEQLDIPPMHERALPPVLVLVSDGHPTDDVQVGLDALMQRPWGRKAVRLAIAIGKDADSGILERFIATPSIQPLRANNPEALLQHLRWVSTAVLRAASAPATQPLGEDTLTSNVPIPSDTSTGTGVGGPGDVW